MLCRSSPSLGVIHVQETPLCVNYTFEVRSSCVCVCLREMVSPCGDVYLVCVACLGLCVCGRGHGVL